MAERKQSKGSRRSENEWRALIAKFGGSGQDVAGFCRREAISAASFYRWRKLLGDGNGDSRGSHVATGMPAFVDLGTLNAASVARPRLDLRLDLGDGLILHLVRS